MDGQSVRVTAAMVDRFARASGDHSPLHVDARYARRTPFGEPVAHGVLSFLAACATAVRVERRRVSRVRIRFARPVLCGQDYAAVFEDGVLRVMDGPEVVLEARLEFRDGTAAVAPSGALVARATADVLGMEDIPDAGVIGTEYRPDWGALSALCDELGLRGTGVDVEHVAVLAWASYVAGMRVPGRAALISGLSVEFGQSAEDVPFLGTAEVSGKDERFRRVALRGEVVAGSTSAVVDLTTFVRREHQPPDCDRIRRLLGDLGGALTGRRALVTGGSRGLGAALVQALAVAGCDVRLVFHQSRAEADDVVAGLGPDGARVILEQADVSDDDQCAELRARSDHRLDFLVLNAGPPVSPLGTEPEFAERAAAHISRATDLARAPLTAFAAEVATVVVVSSAYVTEARPGLAHYVAAKLAVEDLVQARAAEHGGLDVLVARPPRLATTFADSATGNEEPLDVETAAAAIVRRMVRGEHGTMTEFTADDTTPALAVAATFTTDPLLPMLGQWTDRLGLRLRVEPAPFGQVFRELLDPGSTFGRNRGGVNLALVRLRDWPDGQRTVDEFVSAVESYRARGGGPLVVVVCPSSGAADGEFRLVTALAGRSGVQVVAGDGWRGGYDVDDPFDTARDELAHIPYHPAAFAVLATTVARSVHSLVAPPFKALVLDCDNTLWRGVCGEVGPDGVELGAAHRRLQEWVVRRHDEGVIVCLASKNAEDDVLAVFDRRTDFPLRLDHVVARRVNWERKSANLAELAAELTIGLDSVVFLDDNPVEIAEVRAAHPEVLALRLPEDEAAWPGFLSRIWAFDKATVTDEDRARAASYRAGRDRRVLRGTALTFADFIAGLELRIDVRPAGPDDLARVAQLTQRTNQFTLSTIRRTEAELRAELDRGAQCRVVHVSDRFGDYGLVGAAIVRRAGDVAELDTFLLSCRVLGRGVEHAFLAELGREFADARELVAEFVPTAKNAPARTFFVSALGSGRRGPSGALAFRVPPGVAAETRFDPDDVAEVDERTAAAVLDPAHERRNDALATIATELSDVEALTAWLLPDRAPAPRVEQQADGLTVLTSVLADLRAMPAGSLRGDTSLESLRLSSLEIVDATVALERVFGRLPRTLFFEHRTLDALAAALPGGPREATRIEMTSRAASAEDGIAVVGMAGRYPGCADVRELWRRLLAGDDLVGDVSSRWGNADVVGDGAGRTYTAAGGLVDGADGFDARFFGVAPSEAETMDPQQRLLMQVAHHAIQDAGHTAADLGPDVGVFVGAMSADHALFNAEAALAGNGRYPNADLYQLANRISYFFDFTGPSMAVDTACSSSGVALQLAFDAIRDGRASAALVGGVNLILHPARRVQYAQLGMLSRTGRCQPFGAGADGMVTSEGIGMLVLRPLSAALADGDHVYGVVRAVGTNTDGRTNGFMVPSPGAQARLIRGTLAQAGVTADSIDYVEAHGTGTPLGDPIEVRGLADAFGAAGTCAIGSVKGNVGHLEAAAAVVGLTKVLLQLDREVLVPSLHAEEVNPHLGLDATPFTVQRAVTTWPRRTGSPRRAGLSSFGAGGVNVHMVVQEAPARAHRVVDGPELVLVSAGDDDQLRAVCRSLADHLSADGADQGLADVAFTLRAGRDAFAHRAGFVARDRENLLEILARLADGAEPPEVHRGTAHAGLGAVFDGGAEMTVVLAELARAGRLDALGALWVLGAVIDWAELIPRGDRRRVPLPGIPFQERSFALPIPSSGQVSGSDYYRPEWTKTVPGAQVRDGRRVVVIDSDADVAAAEGAGPAIVVDRRGLTEAEPAWLDTAMLLARGETVTYVLACPPGSPSAAAVTGFARALRHESTRFRVVRVESTTADLDQLLTAAHAVDDEVMVRDGSWFLRRWSRVSPARGGFRDGGCYLITGGAGGIGRIIARHIGIRHRANVVLVGRSPAPHDLDDLRVAGGELRYLQADVTDETALFRAVAQVRAWFGRLNGVVHGAGITDDTLFRDKTDAAFHRVLAPKIDGTSVLDRVTADDELDFFATMSSIVGVFGNAGQTDYAAANAYLDAFAERRAAQVRAGDRHGRSVSIVWPIWDDGGMRTPDAVREHFATTLGQRPISTGDALRALDDLVGHDGPVLVASGDRERIEASLRTVGQTPTVAVAGVSGEALVDTVRAEAAALLNVTVEEVLPDVEFGAQGFNSLLFTDFTNRLNSRFDLTLSPAALFEHPTARSLAAHLDGAVPVPQPSVTPAPRPDSRPEPQGIAVIGMAGRLPGAADLDEFWDALIAGRCVTGRPVDRPGLEDWPGGFLDDVTAFDAGFFGISPREARLMDPQQRLFLESAWHAIEHAGYDPRSLAGTATGVFAAVTLHDYSELLARRGEEVHGHTITGHVHGVVANRLSYLLDLSGPSEVVDTACSSSLTALHRAVRALEAGECDTAVVGGVNVLLTGDWFASLDKAGVLSPTGRCWTFDDRADGFVRSEGVGVVMLKPLAQARRDGDTVHGVIRGTAVNHGGRAHSLTAPSPAGQARVIVSALRRAGVDPRTVSYVETHGTGTKLGDPVEVSGLRKAFSELGASGPEPWCGLGAVKGNVGHLESAAGLAGLLKVLLAFRHRTLPRNAAGERQNSHLDLSDGPFTLLSETVPWTPTDRDGTAVPRRAGVSAFGFGGANAHVVLEEPPVDLPVDGPGGDEIVVLSAATSAQLRRYARSVRDTLDGTEVTLADLAYTSRVGRTPLPVRLAVVASTIAALADALTAYLDDRDAPGLHTRDRTSGTHTLAQRWVAGENVEWPAARRRRVPFPVYPFDHSDRHGPELVPETGHGPGLFERTWQRAGHLGDRPGGRCVLIVGRDQVLPLLEALPGRADVDWIVVREPSPLPAVGSVEYEVDFDDHAAGRELAERIVRNHGPVRLLLDLADVMGGHETGREAARVGLLQVLVGHATTGELRAAHLTRGVAEVGNPAPRLAGARLAGLVRAVGAEYRAVHAVTVDVDCAADDLHTQLDVGLRELAAAGGEPEIAHRAGDRWVPRLTRATVRRRGTFAVHADRTYLITGGTGGLGLAAAERLVARGARRIALTGRRPLPDRAQWNDTHGHEWWHDRVAAIRRMEDAGADVRVLTGSLTDETALRAFVGTLAPVAGVLHCAGRLTAEPAFVRKSFDDITRCWEPKGEGLLTLLRVLDEQTPDFVALFSSISSAMPDLAVGLSDYASANAFLDAVAAHRNATTRFLAIGWGSWSGAGMGEVTTPRYRERGLSALTVTEGLDLLDQALATDGPVRVIAVHGDPMVGEAPAVAPPTEDVPDVRRRFAVHLRRTFADALLLDVAAVRPDRPFTDLGVDSILIASVVPSLEAVTGAPVEPSVILEHPTVDRLADHLMAHHGHGVARWAGGQEPPPPSVVVEDRPVIAPVPSVAAVPLAIIGMAGRFPGADTTDAFWELLRTGRSGVTEVPRSRWDVATRYSPEFREGMSIGKWGGFLHGIEEFDPGYFGIAAEDAAHMDPLIRLFLECAATTLADAGYGKDDIASTRTGVFAGSGTSNYASRITVPGRATATGSNQNFIAAHVAQVYDLRGPNLVVDTACSSSLSSLYLARQALLLGECDLALVGGADLLLDETPYLSLSAARALSPDGACHVFDAAANGLVPGEGVGAVLLKRLDQALADGDRVHAVLESVAMNNDGRTMGLTTPNPDAQQQVVLDALTKAGADAGSVSYVEAHGTGTMIGDPIELRALTHVFERFTTERGFCAVGSVKSNLGHLLMAAGMASLQKVVLALRHRALPATLHCDRPNPRFAFDASPFFPNRELREWLPRQGVRRAGISAFGFGGTNCHAIVRDLTAAERESYAVRRFPLPAPEFHRARYWVDRERPALPAPRRMFELEELA